MNKETILKVLDVVFLIAGSYTGFGGTLALRLLKKFLENHLDDILAKVQGEKLAAFVAGGPKNEARAFAGLVLDQLAGWVAGYPVWPTVVEVLKSVVAGPLFDVAWDAVLGNTKKAEYLPTDEAALREVGVKIDAAAMA